MATLNHQEIKRQTDECLYEKSKLESIESDFKQRYTQKIKDIEAQFKQIFDALLKRETDVKQWREEEYNEGLNHINRNCSILSKRLNELQRNPSHETLCRVPQLKDIYLPPLALTSLQIQNVLNMIFRVGQTYQQNIRNRTCISFKMNENPQNNARNIETRITPEDRKKFLKRTVTERHKLNVSKSAFGKGKIYSDQERRKGKTYGNNSAVKTQANGTKSLQFKAAGADQEKNAIRGFDIGNNAKYDAAQEMAKNTTPLPDNFWDDEHGSDSDESHVARQNLIARRWKTERSNINKESHRNVTKRSATQRARIMYNNETSSEEEDADDENDGFTKYVAPKRRKQPLEMNKKAVVNNNNTQWIVHQKGLQHKYDTMWFQVPKMRNGKANGVQMKKHLESAGLSDKILKQIWRLSDLDKDGKMGNEEFVLCMFLIDRVRDGYKLPQVLPPNYIPPSFRGRNLIKTPPRNHHKPQRSQPMSLIFSPLKLTASKSSPAPGSLSMQSAGLKKLPNRTMSPSSKRALPPSYQQAMYKKEMRHKETEQQDQVSLVSISKQVHHLNARRK